MENRGRGRLRGVAVLAAFAAVAVTAAVWTGSAAAKSKADANPFAHFQVRPRLTRQPRSLGQLDGFNLSIGNRHRRLSDTYNLHNPWSHN
jgi:hypothetical protein